MANAALRRGDHRRPGVKRVVSALEKIQIRASRPGHAMPRAGIEVTGVCAEAARAAIRPRAARDAGAAVRWSR